MRHTPFAGPTKALEHRNEYCQLHREDGPAVINSKLTLYYVRDKLLRDGGPAVIYADGRTETWIAGRHLNP